MVADKSGDCARRGDEAPAPRPPQATSCRSWPRAGASPEILEMELRRLKAQFRELSAILDTAMDGVAVLDSRGRILTLNRSGEALFGCDQHEVVGEPFTLLLAPQSRAVAEGYIEGLKSQPAESLLNRGREVSGLARQGGTIPVFMTLGCIGAANGDEESEVRFCALLRDLTHWKNIEREFEEARKEAERASALKSDFLAKVSHEIRTPLNAILGFAEVMMSECFGPIGNQRYKEYLRDIHASGRLVVSLIDDLLDLAKIEAGKTDFAFESIDANRIVSECVSIMQPQASHAEIAIKLSLSPALPNILADERSLRQIVLNLLSNAVKFNRPGGQVTVATALADSGSVVIRIRDNGVGMPEGSIGAAFEPFRRLATAQPSRGTGLGLPLTKALAEANHASITLKSKENEGTLVEVVFPPACILAE
jgi:PAS domain S-box-containing protein